MHRRRPCAAFSVLVSVAALSVFAPAALADSGSISGTVTSAATAGPLSGIDVQLFNGPGQVVDVKSDAAGNYTFTGLAPDPHYVVAFSNQDYVTQYYNGKPSAPTATFVPVSSGQSVTGINAVMQLDSQYTVVGNVTDSVTQAPVQGEGVQLMTPSGQTVAGASTEPNGNYALAAPPGTYVVKFANGTTRYWDQYSNDKASLSTADPVTVTAGRVTANVNAALIPAGSISGTVTNASTGAPAAGAIVDGFTSPGVYVGEATTDSSGRYTLRTSGIGASMSATNSYAVRFDDPSGTLAVQYSGGALFPWSASHVMVTANQTTTGVDAALPLGGQISGTVTDAATHTPLNNINVSTLYPDGSLATASVQTASDGTYTLTGLTPGVPYTLQFSEVTGPGYTDHNYADPFYCDTSSRSAASSVVTSSGAVTSGINEAMWHKGAKPPACPQPTPAQIASGLTQALSVSGPAASIAAILHSGGFPATITVSGPGAAQIVWYYVPAGAHLARATKPIVVASGSKQLTRAGSVSVKLALTAQGRALLKNAKQMKLTAVGSFTPKHGRKTSKRAAITLKH